jgi:hypothetical protein
MTKSTALLETSIAKDKHWLQGQRKVWEKEGEEKKALKFTLFIQ